GRGGFRNVGPSWAPSLRFSRRRRDPTPEVSPCQQIPSRTPGIYPRIKKVIIESVPNFSEGRRPEVVAALAAEARARGVTVLDLTSDPDHHRSVLTFAGPPGAVEEAAFAVARKAVELIDLTVHKGAHPRMGAIDVLPFVPLQGATMADAVLLARRVGARIGSELALPVFLYEA